MKGKKTIKVIYGILFITILISGGCSRKTELYVQELPEEKSLTAEEMTDQQAESSERPLITIRLEDELTMMVRSDYEPFMWLNENGQLTGWIVDVEKAILTEMGQNYRIVPYSDAGKATQDVKSGVANTLVATPFSPDYEKIFNMADPWIFMDVMIFVHNDTLDIGGETSEACIQSLSGKKVGVQARGLEYTLLRDYKDIELIEYETGTVAIQKMAQKTVDAKIEIMQPALYQAKKENLQIKAVGVPLMSVQGTLGFHKGIDPEIIDRYNTALKTIQNNGTYDRIYRRWFSE